MYAKIHYWPPKGGAFAPPLPLLNSPLVITKRTCFAQTFSTLTSSKFYALRIFRLSSPFLHTIEQCKARIRPHTLAYWPGFYLCVCLTSQFVKKEMVRGLKSGCNISLVPRRRGGEEERASGTHCLRMHLIATKFCGDCIRTWMYVYCWCHKFVGVLFKRVLNLHSSMPSSSWIPRDKPQEKTGCLQWVRLPRKHAFIFTWLSTNFSKSIPTMAYQTFLFVPDSIQLSRACSSDAYSILRMKAKMLFTWTVDFHVSTCP